MARNGSVVAREMEVGIADERQNSRHEEKMSSSDPDKATISEGTSPIASTSNSPNQSGQKKYRAIARVQGTLVADGSALSILTDDGAQFPVESIKPGKLSVRLIALLPEDRKGLFSFWPRGDDGIVIASFCDHKKYVQHDFSPLPDEMLLTGSIVSCQADNFVVRVKRNKGSGRGYHWFKGMSVTVSSPPPTGWHSGQWVDLNLQRSGSQWLLPDN